MFQEAKLCKLLAPKRPWLVFFHYTKANSVFRLSVLDKSDTILSGWR